MQSPNPPRPPYPPRPGWTPGNCDRDLAARLGTAGGHRRAVALLLARHWRAAHDYATVCLADTGGAAPLVTAAAFHEVFGRLAGGHPGGALRPQLLVAVRDMVREWAGVDGVVAVLPELRKTVGGRGLRAARPVTGERRQLAERAFHNLPAASQCLLWHTEVEAEPLSIPALLLGVDTVTATAGREQAREQFRTGCVRAHRELAPSDECRFYNRLLDVPLRRGGTLLPDVRDHLARCRYCRHAAEQLSHFDGGLDVLLTETVLGWGARRYLDSRPGRAPSAEATAAASPTAARPPGGTGRHRTTSAGLPVLPGHRSRTVLVGVGLTSLALLATVLVTRGWSGDNAVPGSGATWGAPVGGTGATDTGTGPAAGDDPASSRPSSAAASATNPVEVARGRLRATASGLCLDTEGGRTEAGTAAVLAACSSAASQQWSYQDDGVLRSAAAPALCLAADPGRGTVALAGCVVHSGNVFFDLTVRGELLLRRGGEGLVVAPGTGRSRADVTVTGRDGTAGQRWAFDMTPAAERDTTQGERGTGGGPSGAPDEERLSRPPRPDSSATAPAPAPDGSAPPAGPAPGPEYEKRFARVDCCEEEPEPVVPAVPSLPDPVEVVGEVLGGVDRGTGAVVTAATATLSG
ncbi:RICIN domain-containing protein [Streptomyces phaeoluteigriseus]|uniref:RICIN domain-containing protein n=1 Tax=Streptomyces phaeoluteigriseus TaxID=114686 RepID=A0ABY4ZDM4_9ACTN|nr:RICIN domain-containing protein [Streptomyces phaeoluteigriseus]USQ87040.1 RICIN domain-containing protein [Streptomyces phaeoluteigriseus]